MSLVDGVLLQGLARHEIALGFQVARLVNKLRCSLVTTAARKLNQRLDDNRARQDFRFDTIFQPGFPSFQQMGLGHKLLFAQDFLFKRKVCQFFHAGNHAEFCHVG